MHAIWKCSYNVFVWFVVINFLHIRFLPDINYHVHTYIITIFISRKKFRKHWWHRYWYLSRLLIIIWSDDTISNSKRTVGIQAAIRRHCNLLFDACRGYGKRVRRNFRDDKITRRMYNEYVNVHHNRFRSRVSYFDNAESILRTLLSSLTTSSIAQCRAVGGLLLLETASSAN